MRTDLSMHACFSGLAAAAILGLSTSSARAEPPAARIVKAPQEDPSAYVDPSYDPAAHGGLPYASFLRMSRGTARRSTGMMVTGIVLTGLGAATMALGTGIYAGSRRCFDNFDIPTEPGFPRERVQQCSSGTGRTSGIAMLLAGTIGAAIGVPLWILGGTQVPWVESSGAVDRARPAWARLVPTITPATASRGIDLRWQF